MKGRWDLPPGCTKGTWEYVSSRDVAEDYDRYFASHDLMEYDESFVVDQLQTLSGNRADPDGERPLVADLGCGTGRMLIRLAELGFRGLAVDLSESMLNEVKRKADTSQLDITTLHANWVELSADVLADNSVDHCVSLFNTLGMIQGHANRVSALQQTRRILRPGGRFIFHLHNFWFNLYDAGGPWWVFRSLWKGWRDPQWERGDKYYPYRGVHNMFLHVFTAREIRRLLRESGFEHAAWTPLQHRPHGALRWPRLAPQLRAIGWMIAAW